MSKTLFKKRKDSNDLICAGCKLKVKANDGVQCQGPCSKWRHFRCMDVSACKLQALRAGEIEIRCPCPDCEPAGADRRLSPRCRWGPGASPDAAEVSSQTGDSSGNYTDLHDTTALNEPSPTTRAIVHSENIDSIDCSGPCNVMSKNPPRTLTQRMRAGTHTVGAAGHLRGDDDLNSKRNYSEASPTRQTKADNYSEIHGGATGSCSTDFSGPYDAMSKNPPRTLTHIMSAAPRSVGVAGHLRGDEDLKSKSKDSESSATQQTKANNYAEIHGGATGSCSTDCLRKCNAKTKRSEPSEDLDVGLRQSTERLQKSLTEMRSGFDVLKGKQEAVDLCFQSVKQMCEAVDQLAEKINEVVERVKETVEEAEKGRSRVVSRKNSESSQGRLCFCPANPSNK